MANEPERPSKDRSTPNASDAPEQAAPSPAPTSKKVAGSSNSNRGSRPGERRGGRKKGVPNKKTADLAARLAALNCDPLTGMAKLAMDKNNSAELRGRMYAELAQYIAPKRRAIEHSGEMNMNHEGWLGRLPPPPKA